MLDSTALVGQTLDERFKILREVGPDRGTFLYAALQVTTGRPVTLRVIDPGRREIDLDGTDWERALRQGINLRHPNTATALTYGRTPENLIYVVSEAYGGETLRDILSRKERLSLDLAAHILADVCSSLTEAHTLGLVHGALSPASILVEPRDGEPPFIRVRDYGIADLFDLDSRQEDEALTSIDLRDYIPPELSEGGEADGRADIYSLGAMLYEMLAGRKQTASGRRTSTIWEVTPEIEIPEGIDDILKGSLARQLEERLPSAGVFRERLVTALNRFKQDGTTVAMSKVSEYRRAAEAATMVAVEEDAEEDEKPAWERDVSRLHTLAARVRRYFLFVLAAVALVLVTAAITVLVSKPEVSDKVDWESELPPGGLDASTGPAAAGPDAERRYWGVVDCVTVIVTSEPTNALVTRKGEELGYTPLELCGKPHEPWILKVSKPEYASMKLLVDFEEGADSERPPEIGVTLPAIAQIAAEQKAADAGKTGAADAAVAVGDGGATGATASEESSPRSEEPKRRRPKRPKKPRRKVPKKVELPTPDF